MNSLATKFFFENKEGLFQEICLLHEKPQMTWEEAVRKAPHLPRGWFELSRIEARDRIEFTRDFWLDRIPYHPVAHPGIFEFFEQLDDVAVVLGQRKEGEFFEAQLVYSLRDDSSFFRGNPPAKEEEIDAALQELDADLPRDYMAFLRLHDGFGKLSEMGVLEVEDLFYAKRRLMDQMLRSEKRLLSGKLDVDPGSLIPFYEALGLSSFQCFFTDWYPGSEMGNVYFSGVDFTVSNVEKKSTWGEELAFATFSEWLVNYLQGNICT
jgi:hypothetical protein